jgi:hypothetical protein
LQSHHLHFVVEGDTHTAFLGGVRALNIRLAIRFNRVLGRKGRLFSEVHQRRGLKTLAKSAMRSPMLITAVTRRMRSRFWTPSAQRPGSTGGESRFSVRPTRHPFGGPAPGSARLAGNGTDSSLPTRSRDSQPAIPSQWAAASIGRCAGHAVRSSALVYDAEMAARHLRIALVLLASACATARFQNTIERLTAPTLGGRAVGTAGLAAAERLVQAELERLGARPFFDAFPGAPGGRGFLQPVQMRAPRRASTRFWISGVPVAAGQITPSAVGVFEGPIVEAGFLERETGRVELRAGATHPHVALIRVRARSKGAPPADTSEVEIARQAAALRRAGAGAILFSMDKKGVVRHRSFPLLVFAFVTLNLPATFINGKDADRLDAALAQRPIARFEVRGQRAPPLTAHNVVGTLGDACGQQTPVLIGAHLDGAAENLPAADDNASGVAALLEVARRLSRSPEPACYILAAFTAEESGLIGSVHFAKVLRQARIRPRAMLNLDMVGRMGRRKVRIFGTESSRDWREIVRRACAKEGLVCAGFGKSFGFSDHITFYQQRLPVLHFFTREHSDPHRATDTADKIDPAGGVRVARLAAAIAARVAAREPLPYQGAVPPLGQVEHSEGTLGLVFRFGGRPDFGRGVSLAGAVPGTPADKAGVLPGDWLRMINGQPILGEGHARGVISTLRPGQRVPVELERDGRRLTLELFTAP